MRESDPALKIVYASTRQVYGKPERLPVDETHALKPTDVDTGIDRSPVSCTPGLSLRSTGFGATALRLTNTYGPRQLIRHDRRGSWAGSSARSSWARRFVSSETAGGFCATSTTSTTWCDALQLALRALGIGPGDEVVTSAISAAFTALAIQQTGARPVFVDVCEPTLNLDPALVARALTPRTKAILPVHLYGHPADMEPLLELARVRQLAILEDACQAHGALYRGRPVGTLAGERGIGALSFYPTKNLGALGDGGAVLVNDPVLAARLRQLRNGGQTSRYRHESFGVNSRLDELQAAILRVGLGHLPAWTERARSPPSGDSRRGRAAPHRALCSASTTPESSAARDPARTGRALLEGGAERGLLEGRGRGCLAYHVTQYHVRGLVIRNDRTDLPIKKGLSSSAAMSARACARLQPRLRPAAHGARRDGARVPGRDHDALAAAGAWTRAAPTATARC